MGSNKDQKEIGTRNSPKEVSGKRKRGRSATKPKKAKISYKNKHSKNERRYISTSPSPKRHKSQRKKRKHRKSSSYSSYSSSPSSSSESSKKRSIDQTLGIRLQVISDEDKFRYNLGTDMAEYANTHFETYVKEADLKEQIFMENPVPDNLNQVKKLDDFVRDILKDN